MRSVQHQPVVGPRVRTAACVSLVAYLLFVGWLSLRPVTVVWVAPANLEPLATIRGDLEQGTGHAARTWGAGLLLLAPLGILLPLTGRRLGGSRFLSLARTVFGGAMVALAIELAQSAVPSQVTDVDTLLLNTCGVALIHTLFYGRLRARTPRERTETPALAPRQEPFPPGRTPRTPRVAIGPATEAWNGSLPVR
jgi:VanZ family protein